MQQQSRLHTNIAVNNRSGRIGSGTPLPEATRQVLRALGNLAVKLADGDVLDSDWLTGQLTGLLEVKPPAAATTADLLTLPEACARLRISKWFVYKLIHERELITVKIGTRRFVPSSEVNRFLKELVATGGQL